MNLAAEQAAEALKSLIPSWGLDFSTPSMQLLAPTKLFCIEAMTTPRLQHGTLCSGAGL